MTRDQNTTSTSIENTPMLSQTDKERVTFYWCTDFSISKAISLIRRNTFRTIYPQRNLWQ